MKHVVALMALLALTACGNSSNNSPAPVPPAPAPTVNPISCNVYMNLTTRYNTVTGVPTTTVNQMSSLPSFTNGSLTLIGTESLTNINFTEGNPDTVPGSELTPITGTYNYASNTVTNGYAPSSPYQHGSYFALDCFSNLVISQGGYYEFQLGSDDGSEFLLDHGYGLGLQNVVSMNKVQSFTTANSGVQTLDAGSYPIEVRYFNGPGQQGLTLGVEVETTPGQSSTLPGTFGSLTFN